MRDERVADAGLATDVLEPDLVGVKLEEHAVGRVEELLARDLWSPPAARSTWTWGTAEDLGMSRHYETELLMLFAP